MRQAAKSDNHTQEAIEDSFTKLESWLLAHDFKGAEPFDALRSPILSRLRFNSRWLGVFWVQLFRRSPVNLRTLFGIAPAYNAKGMGLFLAAYLRRYRVDARAENRQQIEFFGNWLLANRSPNFAEACWGYNFDWPNRAFLAPAGTPNIVTTVFIAHALLDRYDLFGAQEDLAMARSACDFLVNRLASLKDATGECFAYTPLDNRYVHNANMLGASLLARVGRITGESSLTARARSSTAFTVARQRPNGSWHYGTAASDAFIDNFHTGFNLVCLLEYARYTSDDGFEKNLRRGYEYWNKVLFTDDGLPKYYSSRTYPIDIHAVAQAILTFLAFGERDPEACTRAFQLARWAIASMQDRSGYFYYQIGRFYRNRIAYIRWSQAWMFRALAECRLAQSQGPEWVFDHAPAGMRGKNAT